MTKQTKTQQRLKALRILVENKHKEKKNEDRCLRKPGSGKWSKQGKSPLVELRNKR